MSKRHLAEITLSNMLNKENKVYTICGISINPYGNITERRYFDALSDKNDEYDYCAKCTYSAKNNLTLKERIDNKISSLRKHIDWADERIADKYNEFQEVMKKGNGNIQNINRYLSALKSVNNELSHLVNQKEEAYNRIKILRGIERNDY